MLSTLIIDDEPFARDELAALLDETQAIEVIGQAGNAIDGLRLINQLKPEVVFLDIQMPQITGIELLAMLDPDDAPQVVFITAYDQYAIQAFEDNAFDYLLKPVDPARLMKTVLRLHKRLEPQSLAPIIPQTLAQLPCYGHNRIVVIAVSEVEFACSELSGVHIQTARQKCSCQLSLKVLEEKTNLIRCHRQYLINLAQIREIRLLEGNLAEIVSLSGHTIPVSRRYLRTLKQHLGLQS